MSSLSAPTEGIVCQQEKTSACVGNNDLGQGCVFVAERLYDQLDFVVFIVE